jgi:hypothetical protein
MQVATCSTRPCIVATQVEAAPPSSGEGVRDLLYLVGQEEDEGYQPDG